ncbi:TetR/AcrR family transcriptional regulator [Actinomycetospora sp. TBRC 11914]|uniref:TetR/AcrR family transcriptional regulator n=1 Tax=Actinomycetospora sp. TBRC 11914 TaxID=2729387 RepID=UPI00145C780D|nr:TetR family transcriptional regulator [Actinomycetospora sp. TBRC 11914]NMO94028.1 TetR family transcriptional regulator [Actinomycetospora sp. TBRC 11914]
MRENPRTGATRTALLNAALDVAAENGVKGVTHRRVATAAGLSLGLTSYYFSSLDDLMLEAFRLFVATTSSRYEEHFGAARDRDGVVEAAVAVVNALKDSQRDRTLLYELYAQSVRDPAYRDIVTRWSRAARAEVEKLYSPRTARFLEAAWEGINAQMIYDPTSRSDDDHRELFRMILARS